MSNWFKTTKKIYKIIYWLCIVGIFLTLGFHVYYSVAITISVPLSTVMAIPSGTMEVNPDGSLEINYTFQNTIFPGINDYTINAYLYNSSNDALLFGGSTSIPIIPYGQAADVNLLLINYTNVIPTWELYITLNQSLSIGVFYHIVYYFKIDIGALI